MLIIDVTYSIYYFGERLYYTNRRSVIDMKHKGLLAVISFVLVCCSFLSACSEKNSKILETPNTDYGSEYQTKTPEITNGKIETSSRLDGGKDEYQIGYFDENGRGTKLEFYKKNKLVYYYVTTGFDADGNATRQEYFDSESKLLAVCDNGYFFDADGNQISEDVMNNILYSVE